jgi:hypothetical protein
VVAGVEELEAATALLEAEAEGVLTVGWGLRAGDCCTCCQPTTATAPNAASPSRTFGPGLGSLPLGIWYRSFQ